MVGERKSRILKGKYIWEPHYRLHHIYPIFAFEFSSTSVKGHVECRYFEFLKLKVETDVGWKIVYSLSGFFYVFFFF